MRVIQCLADLGHDNYVIALDWVGCGATATAGGHVVACACSAVLEAEEPTGVSGVSDFLTDVCELGQRLHEVPGTTLNEMR